MPDLNASPVDPRDAQWEDWNPEYRVYFWRRLGGDGWRSREFQVPAGGVSEAIEWAELNANDGETYALFVVVDRGDGPGIVRLAGQDPTRG